MPGSRSAYFDCCPAAVTAPPVADGGHGSPGVALSGLPGFNFRAPPRYGGERDNDAAKVWVIHMGRWLELHNAIRRDMRARELAVWDSDGNFLGDLAGF